MSSRDRIFESIRKATRGLEELTPLPNVEEALSLRPRQVPSSNDSEVLVEAFAQRWEEAHGKQFAGWQELRAFLEAKGVKRGYADPKAARLLGAEGLPIESEFKRAEIDSYDFAITMADFGIAETGSIGLTDSGTTNRLAALACWIHIAVLPRECLWGALSDAISQLGNDPSIILVTGPSKTADIEGVLIEGVHGPGIQVCMIV